KKPILLFLGAVVVLILILLLTVVGGYNRLTRLSQAVDAQWAQVQNVYQRRLDLIPNLVQTVQGSANFEKSTLEEVTRARAAAEGTGVDPNSAPTDQAKLAQFQQAQERLGAAVVRVLAVAENYPKLSSTENFAELQAQLEGTENRIAVERGRFNDIVQQYNTAVRSFPAVLYAGAMGFTTKPFFTANAGASAPPQVQFNFNNAPATAP
ncbi:MAG TPA: LemA family protein, partial [Tepidisphaeraceae bacterium]|nr:LemA family protein [Tepidisphaeraceae bacterium]